jgi:acyl dehydratase
MSQIRRQTIEGIQEGQIFRTTRTFEEVDMVHFAEITHDYNPIHFDNRFARAKKFQGRICHGLLVGSLLTEIGGQCGWLATRMDFHFIKPVYFGDTITCELTITQIDHRNRATAHAVFTNQDQTVVLEALLEGILPGNSEKEILSQMMAEGDPTNKI